jgi:hypothetical protein
MVMDWFLALTLWYSFLSEPNGAWHFTQYFGFKTQAQCEEYAKNEIEAASKYRRLFTDDLRNIRSMILVSETHYCVEKEK